MIASLVTFALALAACASLSFGFYWRTSNRYSANINASVQLIDSTLALIQLLQKHRGLGAQQSGIAAAQRTQIAREIDYRWRGWSSHTTELNYLQEQWQHVKNKPADFDAHSLIIKHLLGFIDILTARTNSHSDGRSGNSRSSFAERCRALEDLARLRGLSARAAQFPHCPIELKVPLKYLCENLQGADLQQHSGALRTALTEINDQMLDAHHTTISAARCFEMLTPIIDSALDELRASLQTLRQSHDRQLKLDFASL